MAASMSLRTDRVLPHLQEHRILIGLIDALDNLRLSGVDQGLVAHAGAVRCQGCAPSSPTNDTNLQHRRG